MSLNPVVALEQVLADYRSFLTSEFRAKDPGLRDALARELDRPRFLAQEPYFQAHRSFVSGKAWADLPLDRRLAGAMAARTGGRPSFLHQSQAIEALLAPQPNPVVVATSTGSGKTEAFLVPVLENALRDCTAFSAPGLTAILVYPMNALANDQFKRIDEYLGAAGLSSAIRVAKYDRSTGQAERATLRAMPPHILLTNYMMLEYLLVRPADRDGIFANHRCRYLVLDEVHTYRGALGSNIALLVRRLRAHLATARQDWQTVPPADLEARRYPSLTPVATSATIKTVTDEAISRAEARRLRDTAVKEFFGKLAGVDAASVQVFGEELIESSPGPGAGYAPAPVEGEVDVNDAERVRRALCALAGVAPATPLAAAAEHCRLLWDLNRWLVRAPQSLSQLVERVRAEVPSRADVPVAAVRRETAIALMVGAALPDGTPGALRLRVHDFVRGGWQFHRCVNPACGRLYPMGEERCTCGHPTAPLHLCRNCGADYLQFAGDPINGVLHPYRKGVDTDDDEYVLFVPARFDTVAADEEAEEPDGADDGERVRPAQGTPRSGQAVRRTLPQQMRKRPVLHGSFEPGSLRFSTHTDEYAVHDVVLAPARTQCLCCGATAGSRSIVSPLAIGTSSALKVVAEGVLEALDQANRDGTNGDHKERLLIFCDSRQDAAHQARFIRFAGRYDRMRRSLVQLLDPQSPLTLQHVVEQLGDLGSRDDQNEHAVTDTRRRITQQQQEKIRAFEEAPLLDEIAITAGFRNTVINLGLVTVAYEGLSDYVQAQGAALAETLGVDRAALLHIARCLLDEMRIRGALSRPMLRYHPRHPSCPEYVKAARWERRLPSPQGYPCTVNGEPMVYLDAGELPYGVRIHNAWRKEGSSSKLPRLGVVFSRLLSAYGRGPHAGSAAEMLAMLRWLCDGSYLEAVEVYGYRDKRKLIQVNQAAVELAAVTAATRTCCQVCGWMAAGAPEGAPCPRCHGVFGLRPDEALANDRTVQRIRTGSNVPLIAAEHTAQVPPTVRAELEEAFKAPADQARLNLLACSPTLEMGIDVGGLDAVAMRNVPPRPDNYAQRGGRAGRRGRVGLVMSYARSTPHDQYFYDKPGEMIAGEVPAPALALGNRDIVLRHVQAIIFGAADPGLGSAMGDYVTTEGEFKREAIDALINAVRVQTPHGMEMAQRAIGDEVLSAAGLEPPALQAALAGLPERIQDVFERTARQVKELRLALDRFAQTTYGQGAGVHAATMVRRLLGLADQAGPSPTNLTDDRSAGYPLRRFAEFGLLPGYEFPTEPATVRLLGDENEDDPVSTGRTVGLAQFQPEAQVYARAARWKVIGLDLASPWNPRSDEPAWIYRQCPACRLRFDAQSPRCPRCGNTDDSRDLPAYTYAGFVAQHDEAPVLDEEERIAMRSLVQAHPQWNGEVTGRWQTAVGSGGWLLRLSRHEEVRWLNEGLAPSQHERDQGACLTPEARGFALCGSCGAMLKFPDTPTTATRGRRAAQPAQQTAQSFGHHSSCPRRTDPPRSHALVAAGHTDVLRLIVPAPQTNLDGKELQSWGLSLGYALHAGICRTYMLDGSEIDFVLEGPWPEERNGQRFYQVALTFVDSSLGGTGYLERMAGEFHVVANRALEHLAHTGCETACYRCLKSYGNQRFHDLLVWPLAVPPLEAIAEQQPVKLLEEVGDRDDDGAWLDAYAAGVGSPLELKFWRLFEENGFTPVKQHPIYRDGSPRPLTVADFAVPERRLAIYVDGASVHVGSNLRRDRYIRETLRGMQPAWEVVELGARDLRAGEALVRRLRGEQ